ncbi:MAG: PHP domain-containing protein [Clostridiaceae bacterium]|nr:PHP domain-containing protein [Clostridiaceae bacterium]
MSKIDFHMHSIYSCDGEYTPEELIYLAKEADLKVVAITDHNTTKGVDEGIQAGKALDIEVVPAVELDCIHHGIVFHVLGYFIDHKSKKYFKIEKNIYDQEIAASKQRIDLVRKMGIEIDADEALSHAKDGIVTGEIIAEIVLNDPSNADNPLLLPYFPGGARADNPYVNFYWDYCSQGKPAYVHIDYISMKEAISLIIETGGVPVLAHPGINLEGRPELLDSIVKLGIKGIEAYSSYHSPDQNRYFIQQAQEYGLLITGGSDFHGKTKPSVFMGNFGLEQDGMALFNALKDLKD